MDELKIGGKYQHYKNLKYYVVLCVGRDTDNKEEFVVYMGLYDDAEFGKNPIWVRSKKDFLETLKISNLEVPRFRFIG